MKFFSVRTLTIPIILGLACFWAWAFSPWVTRGHPDILESATFSPAAEKLCVEIFPNGEWVKGKNEIPKIEKAFSGEARAYARAKLVREADVLLLMMVTDLENLADAQIFNMSDQDLVRQWLVDWRSYLADRNTWADKLESGEDTPPQISESDGARSTDRIEVFARVNDMLTCDIPNFI